MNVAIFFWYRQRRLAFEIEVILPANPARAHNAARSASYSLIGPAQPHRRRTIDDAAGRARTGYVDNRVVFLVVDASQ